MSAVHHVYRRYGALPFRIDHVTDPSAITHLRKLDLGRGFEPRLSVPKTEVLPLDDPRINLTVYLTAYIIQSKFNTVNCCMVPPTGFEPGSVDYLSL